jgi:uncharacterized RDD family membrane protein YckC
MPESVSGSGEAEERRSSSAGPARQVPLFDDRPKIIPFESITRRRTGGRRSAARRDLRAEKDKAPTLQPALDLRAPAARQRRAVSDEAAVAAPSLRLRAAVLDACFLTVSVGIAATAFYFLGGRLQWTRGAAVPYAGAVLALALFYHLFWCVLGRETAGMRFQRLRLLTFDGHSPDWTRLVLRFGAACLGTVAVGLGPLWAFIDEEGLTWHDHISKTYPAEYNPVSSRRA